MCWTSTRFSRLWGPTKNCVRQVSDVRIAPLRSSVIYYLLLYIYVRLDSGHHGAEHPRRREPGDTAASVDACLIVVAVTNSVSTASLRAVDPGMAYSGHYEAALSPIRDWPADGPSYRPLPGLLESKHILVCRYDRVSYTVRVEKQGHQRGLVDQIGSVVWYLLGYSVRST